MIAVGAYDESAVTGIDAVKTDSSISVSFIGNGLYRLSEAADNITVSDLSGRILSSTYGEIVNLGAYPAGVYIIVADGAVCKVVR